MIPRTRLLLLALFALFVPAVLTSPGSAAPASHPRTPAPSTVPSDTSRTKPGGVLFDASAGFMKNFGSTTGYLTFRGNPTHTFSGQGPVPAKPKVLWRYPRSRMCGPSSVGEQTKTWCGTGWPSQPVVLGTTNDARVFFGAYDHNIHMVSGRSGRPALPPLKTRDIAKGSPTLDPDNFPLLYTGSRDNLLRVIAFDGPKMRTLWSLDARKNPARVFNDDWDGAPLVLDDHLIVVGEDTLLHVVKLNRSYGPDGLVRVAPEQIAAVPGYDPALFAAAGDRLCGFESAVALSGNVAYAANSCGLVLGWDLTRTLASGAPPKRVFRFWVGDDVDASVVVDDENMLYVGAQIDRHTPRSRKLGQLFKLDPSRPDDPVVWSKHAGSRPDEGTWSTPAVLRDLVIWPTKQGTVYGLDRATGRQLWTLRTGGFTLSSPSVVDNTLVIGDGAGVLRAWRLDGPRTPQLLWRLPLGGNIESTPVVWHGRIYVGTRGGYMHAVG